MRKALKTVLCVALVLALAVVIALRVLPPMNTPAQSAAAAPTPVVTAAPTPTPEPDNGLPKVNRQLGAHARQRAQLHRRGRAGKSGRARGRPVF